MKNDDLKRVDRSYLERTLQAQLEVMRIKDYDVDRKYGSFPIELIKSVYQYLREGNTALRGRLSEFLPSRWEGSIADFCCNTGGLTMKIADDFPNAQVYGFDVIPRSIAKAKRKELKNTRVHFHEGDVFNFINSYTNFGVVTFNRACGSLSDKIIQYATDARVPIIVGKFCCHYQISREVPTSKSFLENKWIKLMRRFDDLTRFQTGKNHVSSLEDCDRDLFSEFSEELELSEDEYERIARTTIDSLDGVNIIDLNRSLKLVERGYDVWYDQKNQIVVAKK